MKLLLARYSHKGIQMPVSPLWGRSASLLNLERPPQGKECPALWLAGMVKLESEAPASVPHRKLHKSREYEKGYDECIFTPQHGNWVLPRSYVRSLHEADLAERKKRPTRHFFFTS